MKIHGSALEYTVKPYPRFMPYAQEGLAGARGILVGSRHTAESLWAAMDDPSVPERTRLGPARRGRGALRAARAGRGRETGWSGCAARSPRRRGDGGGGASSFARSTGEAAAALATIEPGDRLVVFVGKLIASKGVELLLAAWPLVLAREPRARLLIVGFGAFRAGLEGLADALARGDLDGGPGRCGPSTATSCPHLAAFLETADESSTGPPRAA